MSRPDRIRAHALRRRNFQPQVSPVSHTTGANLSLPPLLIPSLSSATLYHANRRSPSRPPPPLPPRLDIHLHEGAIAVDDRREISSPSSRGTSRLLVTDEGAKTCPVAERGARSENGAMG